MAKSDGRLLVGTLIYDIGNNLFEVDNVLGSYLLGVSAIVMMDDKILLDENCRMAQLGYDFLDSIGMSDEQLEGKLIDALYNLEELKKEL
jgi:hypothetical protein